MSWRASSSVLTIKPVGLVDHLLLADGAHRRLGRVDVGQRDVLHRGQRVRGVHQRHRPAVAGQPADLAGEPVVRVHDVVVAGLVGGLGAQHPGRERAQLRRQVMLVETLERAGDHVAHQHAGRHPHRRRVGRRRRAGEDLDLDAAAGHVQRRLQDVDVHAAGVSGTRLRQRRGVHRQHRDTFRQRCGRHIPCLPETPAGIFRGTRLGWPRPIRPRLVGGTRAASLRAGRRTARRVTPPRRRLPAPGCRMR